jgi:predicted enzyme involved in methoxymalonyl-ACP biosynthesis
MSFKDTIQDYGIVGVAVLSDRKKDKALEIENWVLSCRVFSRRIENYIIGHLIKKATKTKYNKINFKFHKTKKNVYLQDFLKKLKIKIEENSKYYSTNIENIKNSENTYMNLGKFDN